MEKDAAGLCQEDIDHDTYSKRKGGTQGMYSMIPA